MLKHKAYCVLAGFLAVTALAGSFSSTSSVAHAQPVPASQIQTTRNADGVFEKFPTEGPARQRFQDVDPSNQFYEHIQWAAGAGITSGLSGGINYGPQRNVTRGAFAAFLRRVQQDIVLAPPDYAAYTDVPQDHTFFEHVAWMRDRGLVAHVEGRFSPSASLKRSIMAVFLYRAAGSPDFRPPATPSFNDVPKTHAFFTQIEWLKSVGVTKGAGVRGTNFFPDGTVNRQTMAAFVYRFDLYQHRGIAEAAAAEPVSDFSAVERHDTSLTFAWNPVPAANGYRVEWSRSSGADLPRTQQFSDSVTSVNISGLRAGTNYRVRLIPLGVSQHSYSVSTQTLPRPILNVATLNAVARPNVPGRVPWAERRQAVWDLGNSRHPDVIGLQEVSIAQYETTPYFEDAAAGWVASDGSPYQLVSSDITHGADERQRIAYNPTTVTLKTSGSVPLQDTSNSLPEPRYLAWAVFEQVSTGKSFFFANAHLSVGKRGAKEGKILQRKIVELNPGNLPAVLVGDLAVSQWENTYDSVVGGLTDQGFKDPLGRTKGSTKRAKTGLGPTAYLGRPNCTSTSGFYSDRYLLYRQPKPDPAQRYGKCAGGSFTNSRKNGTHVDYVLTKAVAKVPVWETMIPIDNQGFFSQVSPSDHAMVRVEILL